MLKLKINYILALVITSFLIFIIKAQLPELALTLINLESRAKYSPIEKHYASHEEMYTDLSKMIERSLTKKDLKYLKNLPSFDETDLIRNYLIELLNEGAHISKISNERFITLKYGAYEAKPLKLSKFINQMISILKIIKNLPQKNTKDISVISANNFDNIFLDLLFVRALGTLNYENITYTLFQRQADKNAFAQLKNLKNNKVIVRDINKISRLDELAKVNTAHIYLYNIEHYEEGLTLTSNSQVCNNDNKYPGIKDLITLYAYDSNTRKFILTYPDIDIEDFSKKYREQENLKVPFGGFICSEFREDIIALAEIMYISNREDKITLFLTGPKEILKIQVQTNPFIELAAALLRIIKNFREYVAENLNTKFTNKSFKNNLLYYWNLSTKTFVSYDENINQVHIQHQII